MREFGQASHVESVLASTVEEYLPGSQLVQAGKPEPEYEPAEHDEQLAVLVAPEVDEDLPAEQGRHADMAEEPASMLYLRTKKKVRRREGGGRKEEEGDGERHEKLIKIVFNTKKKKENYT